MKGVLFDLDCSLVDRRASIRRYSADVQGARDLGMFSVWLQGYHQWPADIEPPEMSIERLAELPGLLGI